jgi:hypothetical protein
MSTLYSNTRELKSFKLINKIKKLDSFLSKKKQCGIIISCSGIHSQERILIHEQFLAQKLTITKISNKLIRILCKNRSNVSLLSFDNLLRGSIFLIESNSEDIEALLTTSKINTILNHKPFIFRFLL